MLLADSKWQIAVGRWLFAIAFTKDQLLVAEPAIPVTNGPASYFCSEILILGYIRRLMLTLATFSKGGGFRPDAYRGLRSFGQSLSFCYLASQRV